MTAAAILMKEIETMLEDTSLLRDNFDPQPSPKGEGSPLDYTEWQRDYFSNIPLDDFLHNAQVYDQKNPFSVQPSI